LHKSIHITVYGIHQSMQRGGRERKLDSVDFRRLWEEGAVGVGLLWVGVVVGAEFGQRYMQDSKRYMRSSKRYMLGR
jgi:hypothetical protein